MNRLKWVLGAFLLPALITSNGLNISHAGEEPLASKSFTNWQFDVFTSAQEQCLRTILSHPLTRGIYPDLLSVKSDQGENLLNEMERFCDCQTEKQLPELKLRQAQPIAYRFRDRAEGYEATDQCATNILSSGVLSLNYAITVTTVLHDDLINRLEGRTPASVKTFASESRIQNRMECVHSAIMDRCTKIKSLRHTYLCIRDATSDPVKMDGFYESCPGLSEHDDQFIDLERPQQLI